MNGNKCKICKTEVQGRFRLCKICLRGVQISIMNSPSLLGLPPRELFKEMYASFQKDLKNDLSELYICLDNELWSACNILIFRIFEYKLSTR